MKGVPSMQSIVCLVNLRINITTSRHERAASMPVLFETQIQPRDRGQVPLDLILVFRRSSTRTRFRKYMSCPPSRVGNVSGGGFLDTNLCTIRLLLADRSAYGISNTLPVVRRSSRARWASAAWSRLKVAPIAIFKVPSLIQLKSS